jgi:hypothetical protein
MKGVKTGIVVFAIFTMIGCVQVPKDSTLNIDLGAKTSSPVEKEITVVGPCPVKWPSMPCHHLKELTDGLPADKKLAVIFQANKACVDNAEEALRLCGVKDPKEPEESQVILPDVPSATPTPTPTPKPHKHHKTPKN